ncbi:MAG: permease [Neptuniibacter sp.]
MLSIFTEFASWLIYSILGFDPESKLGSALHFFVEDTTKIFFLLIVMIYLIAIVRASLNVEAVRDFLSGKHRAFGYIMGSTFGAITPFCSCSSIPVFLGFTSAGIPIGITMAFLLTSPLINEVAVLLLISLVGWKVTLIYVLVGMAVGIICGLFLDIIHAEKWLQPFALKAFKKAGASHQIAEDERAALSLKDRHQFAKQELADIFSRVWKWVFIGVGLGSALHGFVPEAWFETNLAQGQWWTVPVAVLAAIPLYSNATGVIPVMESLIVKGLPLGTTMAFCMSTVAASFPEFVLLKQVMRWKLLAIVFVTLLVSFTVIGWVLNLLSTT